MEHILEEENDDENDEGGYAVNHFGKRESGSRDGDSSEDSYFFNEP